jgi:hypothetical protein
LGTLEEYQTCWFKSVLFFFDDFPEQLDRVDGQQSDWTTNAAAGKSKQLPLFKYSCDFEEAQQ